MTAKRLSLCMIVKDEQTNLPRCLASVQDLVDEIVVVDTGSHDRTVEIAKQYGARVLHRKWRGSFAAARNSGLEAASGDWILVLDADEEIEPGKIKLIRSLMDDGKIEGYMFAVVNQVQDAVWFHTESAASVRMWRNRREYRYERDLHEQILPSIYRARPSAVLAQVDVRIRHYGYDPREIARKGKQGRNLPLAKEAVNAVGDDFAHFNLGIELMIHNRYAEALEQLRAAETLAPPHSGIRPKLVKAIVSCFIQLGQAGEAIAAAQKYLDEMPDYTDLHYLKAFALYRQEDHEAAVASFQRCLELGPAPGFKYPGAVEGYGSYEAAWMIGQVEETRQNIEEALAAYRQAYSLAPNWLTPVFRAATLLRRQVSPADLPGALEQLVGTDRVDYRLIVAQGLYVARDYGATIAYVEANRDALGSDERDFLLGHANLRVGRWQEAVTSLAAVSEASPNYREARISLVWANACLGWRAEADEVLAQMNPSGTDFVQLADISLQSAREWFLRAAVQGAASERLMAVVRVIQTLLSSSGE